MFDTINYGKLYFEHSGITIVVKEFIKDGGIFLDVYNSEGSKFRVFTDVSTEDFGEKVVEENLDKQPLKLIESLLKNVAIIKYYKHFFSFGKTCDFKTTRNTIENISRVIATESMWGND